MKIKKLLISACLLLGMSSLSFGQTNLIENWDGNGATGAGSEPSAFGWDVLKPDGTPGVSVSWGTANGGGTRYRDVDASTNPQSMYNGNVWAGRFLYLRWDVYGAASSAEYVFSYPVTLTANTEYRFSMLYQWWANGGQPTYIVSISRDKTATEKVASQEFLANETKNVFTDGQMTFRVPTTGTYYLTFQQSTAAVGGLGAFADLSIVATNTTGVRNELNSESGYAMYPNPASREYGLYLSERGTTNEAVQLYIYSTSGKLQKQVRVSASDKGRIDISDLSAGLYIAKVVTKKGTFNKTIVVQ